MIVILTALLTLAASAVAMRDWRTGWLAAIVCGIVQDPLRKLAPGSPAYLMGTVVIVYLVVLAGSWQSMRAYRNDFSHRFPGLASAIGAFVGILVLAALNGVATFGVQLWKVPALSLLMYLLPLPAVLLGYSWLNREEQLIQLFKFYIAVTAVAMLGTLAEYLRVNSPILGMVGIRYDYIRHLPGIQIRMLSGIYRGPDIMAWHAAMLASISMALAVRARSLARAWPWILLAGWGFVNCLISGRRKAVYMFVVFALFFVARLVRRLNSAQLLLLIIVVVTIGSVIREVRSAPSTEVYARGARSSTNEVIQRFEGGAWGTLRDNLLGSGLGSATQGVRHVTGRGSDYGWQEGGLGKLAAELGAPGLLVSILLLSAALQLMLRISAVPDIQGTSQLIRAALFAIVIANLGNFVASAQAYSDPLLTLLTAFFVGCLFATSTLDERLGQQAQPATPASPALKRPLPA